MVQVPGQVLVQVQVPGLVQVQVQVPRKQANSRLITAPTELTKFSFST